MKPWLWLAGCVLLVSAAMAAEDRFSQAVRPGDYSAAGLAKLTPEELTRLDELVRDYKSGALAEAKREAELAQAQAERAKAAQAEAEARAAKAAAVAEAQRAVVEQQKAEAEKRAAAEKQRVAEAEKKPGLLDRAKVLLLPGTKIEYSTLESRLVGDFQGWEKRTVFQLENGQRWRVAGSTSYVTPPMPPPKVRIVPGALGSFWMEIEGVNQRVRVESLDAK